MKLVKATEQSKLRNLKVKELNRIAKKDELFTVSDERYTLLAGDNKYRVPFVVLVKDLDQPDKVHEEEKLVEEPATCPEEPVEKKEPVVQDEESIKEIKPKKKRSRKKKEN